MTNDLGSNYNFYGLGERVTDFRLPNGIYTIFARDQGSPVDNGKPPGKNMYGSHPFYLASTDAGVAMGGFMFNSNAMDVTVADQAVTFHMIGGIIDFFGFNGPSPKEVV
jgi:alpha-glucosidase (family GH31 glycosyl hydrolase)